MHCTYIVGYPARRLEVPALDLMQLSPDFKPDMEVRVDGYTNQLLFDVAAMRILAKDFKDSGE